MPNSPESRSTIEHRTKLNQVSIDHLHPVTNRVLANRPLDPNLMLDYGLNRLLPPASLLHVELAADLLAEAITAQAKVMIIGDFDADGATSVAVAVRALKAFGLSQVEYLVPNRFEYGYGLTPEIVGMAALRQPDIIVTVDNGISSINGVHAAQGLGMSVIVTDHHLPGPELPTADVIVNPNLAQDKFKSKNLAGVGVIFYVMLALRARLRAMGWFKANGGVEPNMSQFLDLVALGTVADVVKLDHNNRILVQQGLARIQQGHACAGINALLKVAKKNHQKVSATDLGFAVGPRLNAAGRIDDMALGIECLITDDVGRATDLAQQLDTLNVERRAVEKGMQEDALKVVDALELDTNEAPNIYLLHDKSWHQGVIGLVASRIKERMQRPVIALAPSDQADEWKGSARSVTGIHIRDLLARFDALHPNVLSKFGGHAMAAGFSIGATKLQQFLQTMPQVMAEFGQGHDWQQTIYTDGELAAEDFSLELAQELQQVTPWGQGFVEPSFDGVFAVQDARIVGETHLKLQLLESGASTALDAICFGYLNSPRELPQGNIRCVYRLDINEFRGDSSLQLIVSHIEAA